MNIELIGVEVDIALTAGYLIALQQIKVGDSRDLVTDIKEWAKDFIQIDPKEWPDEDYLQAIDQFAIKKLLGNFGIELWDTYSTR